MKRPTYMPHIVDTFGTLLPIVDRCGGGRWQRSGSSQR
jgi:hypothetical protein